MTYLSIVDQTPQQILCQSEKAGCAACCGTYNFIDRYQESHQKRLIKRAKLIKAAKWDYQKLEEVKAKLLEEEEPYLLTDLIKTCPFAGYISENSMGCLIHPLRHPAGEDLRDLAVYPKEVCAGHFCAPHFWLKAREKSFAQSCKTAFYGQIITDAGLVKSLLTLIEDKKFGELSKKSLIIAKNELNSMWLLLEKWPWRDLDARRFGAFYLDKEDLADKGERVVNDPLLEHTIKESAAMHLVISALASVFANKEQAALAVETLNNSIQKIVDCLEVSSKNRIST